MNHLVIKAYKKDDYLARLCYESWIASGFKGRVVFFCQKFSPPKFIEEYIPKWIMDCGELFFHNHEMANYGGEVGSEAIRDIFERINAQPEDRIILCDTDIIVKNNPLNYLKDAVDLAGTGGLIMNEFVHISGQLMIISGNLSHKILSDKLNISGRLLDFRLSICDDTYISYKAHQHAASVQVLPSGLWHHNKVYNFEPNTDWASIINHFKSY